MNSSSKAKKKSSQKKLYEVCPKFYRIEFQDLRSAVVQLYADHPESFLESLTSGVYCFIRFRDSRFYVSKKPVKSVFTTHYYLNDKLNRPFYISRFSQIIYQQYLIDHPDAEDCAATFLLAISFLKSEISHSQSEGEHFRSSSQSQKVL